MNKVKKVDETYYIVYVEDSSPKIKEFSSQDEAEQFLNSFIVSYGSLKEDDAGHWIDYVFKGQKLNTEIKVSLKCEKSKFKVGDSVKLKMESIEWYLSEVGQSCYFPPSGILDKEQQKAYDNMITSMLTLAMDNTISGVITAHNWPNSKESENFRVKILNFEVNIEPSYLEK